MQQALGTPILERSNNPTDNVTQSVTSEKQGSIKRKTNIEKDEEEDGEEEEEEEEEE